MSKKNTSSSEGMGCLSELLLIAVLIIIGSAIYTHYYGGEFSSNLIETAKPVAAIVGLSVVAVAGFVLAGLFLIFNLLLGGIIGLFFGLLYKMTQPNLTTRKAASKSFIFGCVGGTGTLLILGLTAGALEYEMSNSYVVIAGIIAAISGIFGAYAASKN